MAKNGKFTVALWFNVKTLTPKFGLYFWPDDDVGKMHVAENGEALLYDTRAKAQDRCDELNIEYTRGE